MDRYLVALLSSVEPGKWIFVAITRMLEDAKEICEEYNHGRRNACHVFNIDTGKKVYP